MSNDDTTQPSTVTEQSYVLPTVDDVMPPLAKRQGKKPAAAVQYENARTAVAAVFETANGKLEEAREDRAVALRGLDGSYTRNETLRQRADQLGREAGAAQAMVTRLQELWPARAVVLSEIGAYTGFVPQALPLTGEPLQADFQDELGFCYHFDNGALLVGHIAYGDAQEFTVHYRNFAEVLCDDDWYRLSGFMVRCVGSDRLAGRLPARFNVPMAVDSVARVAAVAAHLERMSLSDRLLEEEFGGIEGLMALAGHLRRQAGI